jgi:nitroreductase
MAETNILKEIPELHYTETSDYNNPEEFIKLVNARRSCRVYTKEQIPEEVMRKCLDLALLAPNSSNLQTWEFYWVRDPEKRKQLDHFCLDQPAATTAAEIIVVVAYPQKWKVTRKLMLERFEQEEDQHAIRGALHYYLKIVPLAYNPGFLGLFGLAKKIYLNWKGLWIPFPRKPISHADMLTWAHKSAALACQNLMLAFRSFGYDTCPMEGLDQKRIAKLLGLPKGAEVCMAISAGKRAENGIYGPRIRFERDLFIKEV